MEEEDELPTRELALDTMVDIENSATSNTPTVGTGIVSTSSSTGESVLLYYDIMKMNIAELRDASRKMDLKVIGNKDNCK